MPGWTKRQGSDTASVERPGDISTIAADSQELATPLSGNDLSSTGLEFDDAACQSNLNNIQGALDYDAKTLVWSNDLTVTNLVGRL